ncbi:hypothetical protein BDV96DRAFT_152799 [Lophiotrema nucula]|uniref:C2H2-type domain-containing protein n=1 Tax=Lophiotrema nucula TaxID=690887 RepID=A0A6A5YZK8_9PLEO|nr:hypothetical protein BDV96DRAFT_152799 [Lophiotrema nucula]
MSTKLASLPEELVAEILLLIRQSVTSREFWNCLKTCRNWYRIGLPMLTSLGFAISAIVESDHEHGFPRVDPPSQSNAIISDFSTEPVSELYVSELRSLTVHVLHTRHAVRERPVTGDFFESLTETLQTTNKLTTFSLKFADDGWDFPKQDVPVIPQGRIARLVACLPRSLRNLEIDTASMDLPPSHDQLVMDDANHFCYQISQIIPRLVHVRLRVKHVCQALFGSKTPSPVDLKNLRSIVIWPSPFDDFAASDEFREACDNLPYPPGPYDPGIKNNILIYHEWSRPRQVTPLYAGGFYTSTTHHRRPVVNIEGCLEPGHDTPAPLIRPACEEHAKIKSTHRRTFGLRHPRTENTLGRTPYVYMVAWLLEGEARWAQNEHGGCRYPYLEGNEEGKPFWKDLYVVESPEQGHEWRYPSSGPFACLFPHCRRRFKAFVGLQIHHHRAHPRWPHDDVTGGAMPCPSLGCDRVGLWGFYRKSELEQHLLKHHRYPCTKEAGV